MKEKKFKRNWFGVRNNVKYIYIDIWMLKLNKYKFNINLIDKNGWILRQKYRNFVHKIERTNTIKINLYT